MTAEERREQALKFVLSKITEIRATEEDVWDAVLQRAHEVEEYLRCGAHYAHDEASE